MSMDTLDYREPQCNDEIKHKHNDTTGTVIAKYIRDGKTYFDVRVSEHSIRYNSPAENWEFIRSEEDGW